jgi:hypothetical protein
MVEQEGVQREAVVLEVWVEEQHGWERQVVTHLLRLYLSLAAEVEELQQVVSTEQMDMGETAGELRVLLEMVLKKALAVAEAVRKLQVVWAEQANTLPLVQPVLKLQAV